MIGEDLKHYRTLLGYSLRELAHQVGVTASALSYAENGKETVLSAASCDRILRWMKREARARKLDGDALPAPEPVVLTGTRPLITPVQLRMARVALQLTGVVLMRDLRYNFCRFENGDDSTVTSKRLQQLEQYFNDQGVFFGPSDAISIGKDLFSNVKVK